MRKIEFKVTSCKECPLRLTDRSHGSSGDYCGHPSAPGGYGNSINDMPEKFPKFCPGLEVPPNPEASAVVGPRPDTER